MQRRTRTLGLLIGSVLLFAQSRGFSADDGSGVPWSSLLEHSASYKPGCIMVRFVEPLRPAGADAAWVGPRTRRSVETIVADHVLPGSQVERDLGAVVPGLATVRLPAGVGVQEAVARFNASPYVVYAEPNYKLRLSYAPQNGWFDSQWALNNTGQSIRIPGQPGQTLSPGLAGADINAPEGWDLMGAGKEGDASKVIVAVLDTGIDYNHPNLSANVWSETYTYTYPDPNFVANPSDPNAPTEPNMLTMTLTGYGSDLVSLDDNRIDPNNGPMDENWHGTAVAGIIGATWDSSGSAGICKTVKLLAVRISDGNDISMDVAVQGFGYALSFGHGKTKNKANVINCSWGTQSWPQSLYGAIGAAKGVVVVAAAGNMFDDPNVAAMNMDRGPFYPAGFGSTTGAGARGSDPLPNVISVMATNRNDERASFSNWGPRTVHIGAPGDSIITLVPVLGTAALTRAAIPSVVGTLQSDGVGLVSGTSFAAPHVSGACALALALNPALTPVKLRYLLTKSDAVEPVLPGLCTSGGRLNLAKFLKMVTPGKVRNLRTKKEYTSLTPITDAVKEAVSGDTLVADVNHFYAEPTINFSGKNLILRSGKLNTGSEGDPCAPITFIGWYDETQAKTGAAQVANQPTVLFSTNETDKAVLRGFTIQDGYPGIKIGAISLQNKKEILKEASPRIEGCIITKNSGLGGVVCTGGKPAVVNCRVLNNQSSASGGGIQCTRATHMTITDCNMTGNVALTSGGGLYAEDGSSLVVNGSIFHSNQASDGMGGGLCLFEANADINDCQILANQARWWGGGVYLSESTSPILDCNISDNNSLMDGGGVYWDGAGAPIDIRSAVLASNRALYAGGAIGCSNTTGQITNCLINDNASRGQDGGAVYLQASSPRMANCTFAHNYCASLNTFGGAISTEEGSRPAIRDSIFYDNNDVAVYSVDAASTPTMQYCLFSRNAQGDYSRSGTHYLATDPAFTSIVSGVGNLSASPMFVRGRLGTYYLSNWNAGQIVDALGRVVDPNVTPGSVPADANSPAIDAGSDLAATLGLDQVSTRTDNEKDTGRVDIGFHYSDSQENMTYMLMVQASPTGRATVSPSGEYFREFSQILVTATISDPQWQFVSWSGTDNDAKVDLDPNGRMAAVQRNVVTIVAPTAAEYMSVGVTVERAYVELRLRVAGATDIGSAVSPQKPLKVHRGDTVQVSVSVKDAAYRVRWTNTNDDYSTLFTNAVTMQAPFSTDPLGRDFKEVTAYLFKPRILRVPDEYAHLQIAIDDANDGDIIRLAPNSQPYRTEYSFSVSGKAITITGANPDDPNVTARTVVSSRIFFSGVGRSTVLTGITIRGLSDYGGNGSPGNSNGEHDGATGGSEYGVAIECMAASPVIKNCVFADLTATAGNGGAGAGSSTGTPANPEVGDGGWPGRAYGAGIACLASSDPCVINCTFRNCVAIGGNGGDGANLVQGDTQNYPGLGGGWDYRSYLSAATLATMIDTYAVDFNLPYSGFGGAAYIDRTSSPTFRNCRFLNNSVRGGLTGIGGQYVGGARSAPLNRWQIDSYGGAVFIGQYTEELGYYTAYASAGSPVSKARFISCTFTGNSADASVRGNVEDSLTSYGGAVCLGTGAEPNFDACTFTDNQAAAGGALYAVATTVVTISDCNVAMNRALYGGGMLSEAGLARIKASRFQGNEASVTWLAAIDINTPDANVGKGGGLVLEGLEATVSDSLFQGNLADVAGGGLCIEGTPAMIRNCVVTENQAASYGGGIGITLQADPVIRNCTITSNAVGTNPLTGVASTTGLGGGVYASYNSDVTLIDSIVWGNTASGTGAAGSQIAVTSSFEFTGTFTGQVTSADQGVEYSVGPSTARITHTDLGSAASGTSAAAELFVDAHSTAVGWNAQTGTWDPNTQNLRTDPLFVAGFYLSQTAAGQSAESPCVGAGSEGAGEPNVLLSSYTTRTDGVSDSGPVDLGYHYAKGLVAHRLTVSVLEDPNAPGLHGSVTPTQGATYEGVGSLVITLTAKPDKGYRVKRWTGTDNDALASRTNTVTVDRDKAVTVEFEKIVAHVLLVPSQFSSIQGAIDGASEGDTVMVAQGVYRVTDTNGIDLKGQSIRIASTDPNDPTIVANTVIECVASEYVPFRALYFHNGEGSDTVIDGLTIRNGFMRGPMAADGRYGVLTPSPYRLSDPTNVNSPPYAEDGSSMQGDGYGGGILCQGSSPTISKCVIANCRVAGARGGDGAAGMFSYDGTLGIADSAEYALGPWYYLSPTATGTQSTSNGQFGGYGGTGYGNGYGGGIACLHGSSPRLVLCTFKDNVAQGGLGGYGGRGGTAASPDGGVNFSGTGSVGGNGGLGVGDGSGGAFYADGTSRPVCIGCKFINNMASVATGGTGGVQGEGTVLAAQQGGPARAGSGGLGFSAGHIVGGAACLDIDSKAAFTDCTFSGNKAVDLTATYSNRVTGEWTPFYRDTRGGALYCGAGTPVTLRGCTFEGNWGGAVCVEGASPAVEVNECRFSDNQYLSYREPNDLKPYVLTSNGGTLYVPDDWALEYYYDTYSIYAYYTGGLVNPVAGGLQVGSGCTNVDIRHTDFHGNLTCDQGGAIQLHSDATLTGCWFGSNEAANNGGAIRAVPSSTGTTGTLLKLDLEDCAFARNLAGKVLFRNNPTEASAWGVTDSSGVTNKDARGGAAHLSQCDATLAGCHFFNNQAKAGGALFLADGKVHLTGGSVQGNVAIGGSGVDTMGGIDLAGHFGVSHTLDLSTGTDIGGGIVLAMTGGVIENCVLADNAVQGANGHGGAISVYGGSVDHVIRNCLFKANAATAEGGAISSQLYAAPAIADCTFVDNTAGKLGGAVGCDWSSKAVVTNSILQGSNHGAIGEEDTGDSQVTYSLFHNNPDGDYAVLNTATKTSSVVSAKDKHSTNLAGDPLFVAGPLGAFYLSQTAAGQSADSPALSAGSVLASAAGMDTLTTATSGQADDGQVDLGYHFVDHRTLKKYTLKTAVQGTGSVSPAGGQYYAGTLVTLTASPGKGWRVDSWPGAAAPLSQAVTNAVLMNADTEVTVVFSQANVIHAQPDWSVQRGIDSASAGDTVIIPSGTHATTTWDIQDVIIDKPITLTGTDAGAGDGTGATILKDHWLYIMSPGVTVEGLTFTGLSKIRVLACSPTIRNCRFVQCYQPGGTGLQVVNSDGENGGSVQGGALEILQGSPAVTNCSFLGCFVRGGIGAAGQPGNQSHPVGYDGGWAGLAYGGAVYCGFASDPVFEDCHFEDNYAQGGNGGDGGNGAVINGVRYHGGLGGTWEWPASQEGGAGSYPYFYFWDGWQFGPYNADGSPRTSVGAAGSLGYFKPYWTYSGYGGAVYCENDSSPRFLNCTFNRNRTSGGLSGIGGLFGGDVTLVDYRMPNRRLRVDNFGGTIYATQGCALEFVKCQFEYGDANTAVEPNATPGVLTEPADIYVSYGGAIAVEEDCSLTLTDCNILGSRATVGGAIYAKDSKVVMVDTTLADCTAYIGGAVYTADCNGSVEGATLTNNRAEYVMQYTRVVDTNDANIVTAVPLFDPGLIQSQGGAYYCLSSPLAVTDSVFTGNEATYSGGGIYYAGNDQTSASFVPLLHNCLLTKNVASRDGGAVSVNWYAKPILSNCTIADNRATGALGSGAGMGGGLYVGYESDAEVKDSILWGNAGVDGAQVAVSNGFEGAGASKMTITHTTIGPVYDPNSFQALTAVKGQTQGTAAGASASTTASDQRLVDGQSMYSQFDAGQSSVDVIVTLLDNATLRAATQWGNADSESALRADMADRQQQVLSKMTSADMTVKYQYQNIPAFSGHVTLAGLDRLLSEPTVAHIEPVRHQCIMMRQALSLGNATEIRQSYDGSGIGIAIVDTGVDYTHPMLGGGGFPNKKVVGGYDTGNRDPNPMPAQVNALEAHGTCCAGIAAGTLGEFGDYIGGVAPNAKIYALKASEDGRPVFAGSALLAAWDWCITHRNDNPGFPIKVISNSLGGGLYISRAAADAASPAFAQEASVATAAGITIVAASGNNGAVGGISFPAAISNVIAVGALYDTTSQVTGYSNSSSIVDILAPADPVYTTDIVGAGGFDPGDYFAGFNGTSSACPFVAGAVADVQSAAWQRLHRYLTPVEVKALLVSTGDPVTDPKSGVTTPRVNLGQALAGPWGPPIRVESNCVVNQFTASTSADYNAWNPAWDAASGNLTVDPDFAEGYYLARKSTGQAIDSPCIDAGSADVNDPNVALVGTTTSTDGTPDVGRVDQGYHYTKGLTSYRLTVSVVPDPNDGLPHGSVQPPYRVVYEGASTNVVTLQARPDEGYKVKKWTGTDDDASTAQVNRVTVTKDTQVTVQFVPAARHSFKVTVLPSQDGQIHGRVEAGVLDPNGKPNPIDVSSGSVTLYDGTVIQLTAVPNAKYELTAWHGTDADTSKALVNTVTIRGTDLAVTVEFQAKVVRTLSVPGDYATIQAAVDAAGEDDTIVVDPGTYRGADSFYTEWTVTVTKPVTITSRNPDDPAIVAATIIDGYATLNNFHTMGVLLIGSTQGKRAVLDGFTIQNCGGRSNIARDGDRTAPRNHPNGYDGGPLFGAGILVYPGANPIIKNCIIRDNSVVGGNAGNGVVADATHNAGRGGWGGFAYGAGAYCGRQSSPTFVNCTFENNWARGGDAGNGGNGAANGGYANYGGNYTPYSRYNIDPNSMTRGYVADELWKVWQSDYGDVLANLTTVGGPYIGDYRWYSGYGGGVFCDKTSQVEFVRCTIRGNHTFGGMSGRGGVPDGTTRNIEPLVPYEVPSFGGGVYCATDTTVSFKGCTLENNLSSQVLSGVDPNHRLDPYAGSGGGVCAEDGAKVSFIDCNIAGNRADSGGGVYLADASVEVLDSNLVSNSAFRGGGLFGLAGSVTIDDCNVVNNRAERNPNDPNSTAMSGVGAGLMMVETDATVRNSRVSSNLADGSGGGLYLRGQGTASVFNCLFTYNQTGRDGGAISTNWFAVTRVGSSTFVGNSVTGTTDVAGRTSLGGAIFCGYESSCTVLDSILSGNAAVKGSEIAVGTGFDLDPRPGRVYVAYSDIRVEPNDLFVDTGCTLDKGDGLLSGNPLFVSGPLGSYYLSQVAAGQAQTSPCVDAGSDAAGVLGLSKATTATDGQPDTRHVDMGYHYPILQPCKFCDVVSDGVIDFKDFAKVAENWLRKGCNETNGWCGGSDVTFDGTVDRVDLEALANCWLVSDKVPPMPNPPQWQIEPYRAGAAQTTVDMTAKTSEDAWWGRAVEYRFECVRGDGHSSGWQASPEYSDTLGLQGEASYAFKVRDALGNETDASKVVHVGPWSGSCEAPTGALNLRQTAVDAYTVTVTGNHLTDPDGVQYLFEIQGTSGVTDSNWIEPDPNLGSGADPNYRFTGLRPSTQYSVRYKARDKASGPCDPQETQWSAWIQITTSSTATPDVTPPQPNPMTWDTADDPNGPTGWGGKPFTIAIDIVTYAARMTASLAIDAGSGNVEYYFAAMKGGSEDTSYSSKWTTARTYQVTIGPPPANAGYSFKVKARDAAGNETGWSSQIVPE